MRIATFNIQHGRGPDGRVDTARLVAGCASLDADLLALQEVDAGNPRSGGVDQAKEVASATATACHYAAALEMEGGSYGHALLVRGELDAVEEIDLPRHRRREPRVAILARARPGAGAPLSVAATHLSFHADEVVDQLRTVVAALLERPPPRLLLGDLNVGVRAVDQALAGTGLVRARSGATWPAGVPRRVLDHVAVDGLALSAVAVVSLPLSDHRALVVEV